MARARLIIWTGPKHSGKTTTTGELAERAAIKGVSLGGVLSESLYQDGELVGFDVIDIKTDETAPLAKKHKNRQTDGSKFEFIEQGFILGKKAIATAMEQSVQLLIVDEFGPLEINGGGWRKTIDSHIESYNGLVILVVRKELAEQTAKLYPLNTTRIMRASEKKSIETVLEMLSKTG